MDSSISSISSIAAACYEYAAVAVCNSVTTATGDAIHTLVCHELISAQSTKFDGET